MDIRSWLQHTVDRASPNAPELERPDTVKSPHTSPDRNVRRRQKYCSKRKREHRPLRSSQVQSHTHKFQESSDNNTSAVEERSITRSPQADNRNREHASDSAIGAISLRGPYDRRARRKTRPDRYEPVPKQAPKAAVKKMERRSKRTGQKERRAKDGARTRALVQSFEMRNGPKKKRLTLQTSDNLGIFRHGRASHQTSGGRAGLPDLAFNEMKFLQKMDTQGDDQVSHDPSRRTQPARKRREERKQVSAYFQIMPQSPERQRQENPPHSESTSTKDLPRQHGVTPTNIVNANVNSPQATQESSQGLVNDGDGDRSVKSRRCFTWSESAGGNELPSLPSLPSHTMRVDHANNRETRKPGFSQVHHVLKNNSLDSRQDGGDNYIAPHSQKTSSIVPMPFNKVSLPVARGQHDRRSHATTSTTRVTPAHYMSDILQIGTNVLASEAMKKLPFGLALEQTVNKENIEPVHATPTSSSLRRAFDKIKHTTPITNGASEISKRILHAQEKQMAGITGAVSRIPPGMPFETPKFGRPTRGGTNVVMRAIPHRGVQRSTDSSATSMFRIPHPMELFEARPRVQFLERRSPSRAAICRRDVDGQRLTMSTHSADVQDPPFLCTSRSPTNTNKHLPTPYFYLRDEHCRTRQADKVDLALLSPSQAAYNGPVGMYNDAIGEDTPAALLSWDLAQSTDTANPHEKQVSPENGLNPIIQQSTGQMQKPLFELKDGLEDEELESIPEDPLPSQQEFDGFWRPQKFY